MHRGASIAFVWLTLLVACNTTKEEIPLFELLSPDYTGVDFNNIIIENDSLNTMKFMYLYDGAGVAVGDLNNDGWTDLFFSGNVVHSKIYLNKTQMIFEDISFDAGINDSSWCNGVSMVDINQDGYLDIYVSVSHIDPKQAAPNLLYVNQGIDESGNPKFEELAEKYGLADTGYSIHSAFFDYDRDGDLDLFILTNGLQEGPSRSTPREAGPVVDGSTKNTDRLYRNEGPDNEGNVAFTDVSRQAGILIEGWGLGVAINDINRDGWPDIYVANDFLSSDVIYINQGDGTFKNEIENYLKHQSHNGMGIDLVDFNNDALVDIIELDMMPDDNRRQKSMFGSINYNQWHLRSSLGYQNQYVRNTLQINNGDGSFSEIGQLAGIYKTDWSWAPLLFDMDHDGFRDLMITNGYPKDVTDLDYANYRNEISMFGTDSIKYRKLYGAMDQMMSVKEPNYLFRNSHTLRFEDISTAWGFTNPSYSSGAAYGDFDNDGDLDIAISNINDPAFIYRNNTQELNITNHWKRHFIKLKLVGMAPNLNGLGAKVTIQYMDSTGFSMKQYHEHNIYRGYESSVEPIVHFGLGVVDKITRLHIVWPDSTEQLLLDVPVDQVLTLYQIDAHEIIDKLQPANRPLFIETHQQSNLIYDHKEINYVDFYITPLKPHKHSQNGPGMAVGDVDGNGLEDLFIGGSRDFGGTWFMQQTSDSFIVDSMTVDQHHEDMGSLLFDADLDGDLDLYVVSGGSEIADTADYYQDRFYRNDGKGNFTRDLEALPYMPGSGSCVTAADYDKDGDLDLFVGGRILPSKYPLPARSYLLQNENGRFTDVTNDHSPELSQVGLVTAALWTDVDRDGWKDLMIVGEWMPITIFQNQKGILRSQGAKFSLDGAEPFVDTGLEGWWNSLAAGDFDKDGDIDYVAGNLGYNTRFQASQDQPVRIYVKDFDLNGSLDAVMSYYIQNENYPYHPKDMLTRQIPAMQLRFPYFSDYGNATVKDLFTQQELKDATVIKSTYFATSYLENLGNWAFRVHQLPIRAQFAPVFGLQVMDFNGDGNLDILMIGNSYSPDVHQGNYDAMTGLLLLGNGEGKFNAMPGAESGFHVQDDAKSLVRMAMDSGGYMVVAASNQGPLKAFRTQGISSTNILDTFSSDSYLEIEDISGNKWIEEIYYGSGYLSQGSRKYFVGPEIKRITVIDFHGKKRLVPF